MSERATELAKFNKSEQSKLDYFVLGISAATFSYFAKDFKLIEPLIYESALIISALLLLCLSSCFGLVKINSSNEVVMLNSNLLDNLKKRAVYKAVIKTKKEQIFTETGVIVTPDRAKNKIEQLEKDISGLQDSLKGKAKLLVYYQKARDIGLIAGYTTLFLSKIVFIFTN